MRQPREPEVPARVRLGFEWVDGRARHGRHADAAEAHLTAALGTHHASRDRRAGVEVLVAALGRVSGRDRDGGAARGLHPVAAGVAGFEVERVAAALERRDRKASIGAGLRGEALARVVRAGGHHAQALDRIAGLRVLRPAVDLTGVQVLGEK